MPANGSDYSGILPFTVVDTALLGAIGVVLVVGWVGLRIVTRPGPSA